MPISSLLLTRRGNSVSVTITEDTACFNLWDVLGQPTWAVNWSVSIPEGVTIRGGNVDTVDENKPAFSTVGMNPASSGRIDLAGKILGRGGRGGLGAIKTYYANSEMNFFVAGVGGGGAGSPLVGSKIYPELWSNYYQRAYEEILGWTPQQIQDKKGTVTFSAASQSNAEIIYNQFYNTFGTEELGGPAGPIPVNTNASGETKEGPLFVFETSKYGIEGGGVVEGLGQSDIITGTGSAYTGCNPWELQEGEAGQTALRITCPVEIKMGENAIIAGGGGGGAGGSIEFAFATVADPVEYDALSFQPTAGRRYTTEGGIGGARGEAGGLAWIGEGPVPEYAAAWQGFTNQHFLYPIGYGYGYPGERQYEAANFGAAVESSHLGYATWSGVGKQESVNVFGIWPNVNNGEKPGLVGNDRDFLYIRDDDSLNGIYDPSIFSVTDAGDHPGDTGLYMIVSAISGLRPYSGEYVSTMLCKSSAGSPFEEGELWKRRGGYVFNQPGAADSESLDFTNNPIGPPTTVEPGSWHYEVSDAVYNPLAPVATRWSCMTFKIAWIYDALTGGRVPNYSSILLKQAERPFDLSAGVERNYICSSALPAPYGDPGVPFEYVIETDFPQTVIDVGAGIIAYSEIGLTYFNSKIYLAIEALSAAGTQGVLMFSSVDNLATLVYTGLAVSKQDMTDLGYTALGAAQFYEKDSVLHLCLVYKEIGDEQFSGTKIATFNDPDTASLVRDVGTGFIEFLPEEILSVSLPNEAQRDGGNQGGGQAGYDPAALACGVTFATPTLRAWPSFASCVRSKVNPA